MSLWAGTLGYALLRTLLAAGLTLVVPRDDQRPGLLVGQLSADLLAPVLLFAYVNQGLRERLGAAVLPAFYFVAVCEALARRRAFQARDGQRVVRRGNPGELVAHRLGPLLRRTAPRRRRPPLVQRALRR